MKTVTVSQFLGFSPCYSEEKIRELAGGKTEFTALDVLDMTKVPAEDRLWAVLREEFIDAHVLHEFSCRCAEQALALVDNPDPRSIEAIRVKRAWLKGEATDEELSAAWAAASSAARDAAWDAARAAAWSAAWDAAWSAARAEARDAASSAARAEARAAQIAVLIEMLGE